MNLLDTVDETSDVLFVNFNQDCSSLAVGYKKGYKLYNLNQVDGFEIIHENTTDNIRIIERLFSSSLVALVTVSSPRKLMVCHFRKGSEICNYSYSDSILAVKLNRSRLVVCLGESLYIHNIRDMKVLHMIRDTPPNPHGLCVLSVNSDSCYLAYPGSNTIGEVQIFDGLNLQAKSMIPAHDNPLAAMAFDPSGTKLATASEKGTVIRVFCVSDGTKLYEFRRGVKRCVSIYSLSFSEDSVYLSASSNTETVHIFRLDDYKEVKPSEEPQSWIGYLGKAFIQSATYLPSQVADMFCQGRSFATVHLPFSGMKNVCALVMIQKVLRVVVVSREGVVYIYNLDVVEGGDCSLVNSLRIVDSDEENEKSTSESSTDPAANPVAEQGGSRRSTLTGGASYAAVVRGNESSSAQDGKLERGDSDSSHPQMPPNPTQKSELKIDDESEFPPMSHKIEL